MSDNGFPDRSALDALFADIVAHWDEEGTEPGDLARTADDVAGAGPDRVTEAPDPAADPTADPDRAPLPEPPALTEDADPGQPPAPAPLAGPPARPTGADAATGVPSAADPENPAAGAVAWRAHTPPQDEPEEHYVPPPPEPLPAGDLQFWGILIGLGGGPLLLLYLVLFGHEASDWWTMLAIGLTVGGFGLLVSRLPGRRDDDGDDGARV